MFAGVTCLTVALIAAVFAVPGTKERRSYSEGLYWRDSVEDASVAGDGLADCSDDDSESVEVAFIINKREAPEVRLPRSTQTRPRDRARRHKLQAPIIQPPVAKY